MSANAMIDAAKWLVKDVVLGWELPRLYAREAARTEVDPKKALFVNGKLEDVPDAFGLMMPYVKSHFGIEPVFVGLGQQTCGALEYYRRCRSFVRL